MSTHSPATSVSRRAAIYRKAAQLLERNVEMPWGRGPVRFACFAIASVEYPNDNHELCDAMKPLFEVEPASFRLAWLDDDEDENTPSAIDKRILALCFMAAMVEAGDA